MKPLRLLSAMLFVGLASPAFATVAVSSPSNNATVGTSVPVVATSSTSCARGVAASGIYVDNALMFVANGNSINTSINLPTGKHYVVVQEWDYCNGSSSAPMTLNVVNSTPTQSANVVVTSPANGSNSGSSVQFAATGTTSCAAGVSAMGVYVNDQLVAQTSGATLNTAVNLGVGTKRAVVQQWDRCGGSASQVVNVNVVGTTLYNVHLDQGWNQWGELAPKYDICDAPCNGGITWNMLQNQANISTSGNATRFDIGGTTPYSDVLWSDPVLGQGNRKGLNDSSHTLLPTLHNFTLDTDVYVSNLKVTQDLEFDINWYGNGLGFEWGTECNHLDGGVWDYWDNVNAAWIHTNIPCALKDGSWNHVTVQVQRTSDNQLLYQSITVNGVTTPMNITVPPMTVPTGWWGMTVNYQMDGDYAQHAYSTYLDKTNFTYY